MCSNPLSLEEIGLRKNIQGGVLSCVLYGGSLQKRPTRNWIEVISALCIGKVHAFEFGTARPCYSFGGALAARMGTKKNARQLAVKFARWLVAQIEVPPALCASSVVLGLWQAKASLALALPRFFI